MVDSNVIGMDISKSSFDLCWIERGEIKRRHLNQLPNGTPKS